jgi:hypothetical protein
MSSIIRATTTSGLQIAPDNSGSLQLQTNGTTTAVTIDTSQNVGIGTTSPDALLTVNTMASFGDGAAGTPSIAHKGDLNTGLWFPAADTIAASTAGSERMRIDASGYLLVGTATPNGTIRAVIKNTALTSTTKAANTILKVGAASTNNTDSNIVCSDFALYDYYFGGRGGVAYVTVNNNQGVQLSVGATSWSSDSDESLKDIIEPITNALGTINQWRTVIGKYKTDPDDKRRVFFIAQDFQESLPEAIDKSLEGTLLLRYQDVIPVLTAAIKEQQQIIIDLKAIVDAQSVTINDLKARIETLEAK